MNTFTAILIIEGRCPANYVETTEAWQTLIDTGMISHLKGFYAHAAQDLINKNVCQPLWTGRRFRICEDMYLYQEKFDQHVRQRRCQSG